MLGELPPYTSSPCLPSLQPRAKTLNFSIKNKTISPAINPKTHYTQQTKGHLRIKNQSPKTHYTETISQKGTYELKINHAIHSKTHYTQKTPKLLIGFNFQDPNPTPKKE
ncbi:hypothetical protein ACOSQ3_032759 [Xanthoceras sorbifolium]